LPYLTFPITRQMMNVMNKLVTKLIAVASVSFFLAACSNKVECTSPEVSETLNTLVTSYVTDLMTSIGRPDIVGKIKSGDMTFGTRYLRLAALDETTGMLTCKAEFVGHNRDGSVVENGSWTPFQYTVEMLTGSEFYLTIQMD